MQWPQEHNTEAGVYEQSSAKSDAGDVWEKRAVYILMPAAEAIYTPYDFRFVYSQRQAVFEKKAETELIEEEDATMFQAEELAAFAKEAALWNGSGICSERRALLSDTRIGAAE